MSDKALLKDMIGGLETSIRELNGHKDAFIKAKGLAGESEKLRAEVNKLRTEIADEKENLKALTEKKNAAVMTVSSGMAKAMNEALPAGSAIIQIQEDGSCFIGWNNGRVNVPYSGLSGGEKAAFDPALCRALGASIMIVEAAELDDEHLTEALRKYSASGMQCIVNTCHQPEAIPLDWKVIRL
jgi:hypothetical protein